MIISRHWKRNEASVSFLSVALLLEEEGNLPHQCHAFLSIIAPVPIINIGSEVLTNFPRIIPRNTVTNVKRIGTNHKMYPLIGITSTMVYH